MRSIRCAGGCVVIDFGGGLQVVAARNGWHLLAAPAGAVLAAVRVDETNARCHLGLAFLGGSRIVDVSIDPCAWVRRLRFAAIGVHEHPERWAAAAGVGLDRLGVECGWWRERLSREPERASAMAAWPLCRPSLVGDAPVRTIPRWAAGLFAGPSLKDAVRREFGERADRRVVRHVGRQLQGPVGWWSLAVALALGQLDRGRTADLLENLGDEYRCSESEFALLSAVLSQTPTDRAFRLITSASDEGGPQRLLAGLDNWIRADQMFAPVPATVTALEEATAAVLRLQPPDRPVPARRARAPRRRQPRRRLRQRLPANEVPPEPRRADVRAPQPAPPAPEPLPARFEHPALWRQAGRAQTGDVELVLPVDPAELEAWGRALHNCLGGYAKAVRTHRRLVLGIRVKGVLTGAVSADPVKQTIIEISGGRNRPLEAPLVAVVNAMLHARGIIRFR